MRKWKEHQVNSVFHSFPSELHLDGNYLQCSGALDLLRPVAEYAEMQGKDQPATCSPDPRHPPQLLQGKQGIWLYTLLGPLKEGKFCFAMKSSLPSDQWRCLFLRMCGSRIKDPQRCLCPHLQNLYLCYLNTAKGTLQI